MSANTVRSALRRRSRAAADKLGSRVELAVKMSSNGTSRGPLGFCVPHICKRTRQHASCVRLQNLTELLQVEAKLNMFECVTVSAAEPAGRHKQHKTRTRTLTLNPAG